MDDKASLDGPLAKLDRAWLHLSTLNRSVGAFKRSKTHAFPSEVDAETGDYVTRVQILRPPPNPAWGLLIGDIAHNTRSALDHLVWQLVLLSGNKPGRGNRFPIFSVKKDYWEIPANRSESNRDRMLKGVSEEYRAIIDGAQPHRAAERGDDPAATSLSLLSWLSNVDKHQVVHATFVHARNFIDDSFRVDAEPGNGDIQVIARWGTMEDGAEILRLRAEKPQTKVKVKGNLQLSIALGDGRMDLPGLNRVIGAADLYVWSFKPLFEGKPYRGFRATPRPRPVAKRQV